MVCASTYEDVHITADDVIVMFHDVTLDRTTNSKGYIAHQPYFGPNGIEHARTIEEPVQQIPTFEQLCRLLMEKENRHVKLNVRVHDLLRSTSNPTTTLSACFLS